MAGSRIEWRTARALRTNASFFSLTSLRRASFFSMMRLKRPMSAVAGAIGIALNLTLSAASSSAPVVVRGYGESEGVSFGANARAPEGTARHGRFSSTSSQTFCSRMDMLCCALTKEYVFPLVVEATCFLRPGSPAYFAAISALLMFADEERGTIPSGALTGPSDASLRRFISAADR